MAHRAMEGFVPFVLDLTPKVLQHGTNVSTLGIMAPRDGLIGFETPVPGMQLDFPRLTTLTLTNLCLNPSYLDFFTRHRHTLKSLVFFRCWTVCFADEDMGWDTDWCEVFDSLQQPESVLNEFHCVPAIFSFTDNTKSDTGPGVTDDEIVRWEEVVEILKQKPGTRAFHYAVLDEESGSVYADTHGVLQSLKSGADQRSFDSLMELVKQNKALEKVERKTHSRGEQLYDLHEPLLLQTLLGPG